MKPLDLKRFSNFQKIRKIFIFYVDLDSREKKETRQKKKKKKEEKKKKN